MSLELIKEAIRINQVIGEEVSQTVVENDIIVPDVKPDIARILIMDGEVFVKSTETMQDKVVVNGTIHYKILYVPDESEQSIKSINTSVNFSYGLNVAGCKHGMASNVKCDIEHIEYEILNGRKVNAKAIIRVSGKISDERERQIVYDISGAEDIQILRSNYNVNSYVGSNENSVTIRETMEIPAGKPAIKEILRNDLKINGKDYKITDGKIITKGELNISTLYTGDDESQSIQFMEHEIPFTQFIDLPGISENAVCRVEYTIADSFFEAEEDSDGEFRVLKAEVIMDIGVEGYVQRNIEVVSDAYSPMMRLSLEKEKFKIEEFIEDSKNQINLKEVVQARNDTEDIAEVFDVLCKPVLSEYRILNDNLVLEGLVNAKVLYLANNTEQPVFCSEQEIPFKHEIEFKGINSEMNCDIALDVEHCSFSIISSREIEIRPVINVSARIIKENEIPLICKAVEAPIDEKRLISQPSITIYFTQPGDTLWKIAKKYYTTVDDIQRINDLSDEDSLSAGQQIIIPRRVI